MNHRAHEEHEGRKRQRDFLVWKEERIKIKIKFFLFSFFVPFVCFVVSLSVGCASQVKPKIKAEAQLTKQDVKDVVADVVKQSSQNGLFNFNLDGETAGGIVGLGVLAYVIGSLGKGSWRMVSTRKKVKNETGNA